MKIPALSPKNPMQYPCHNSNWYHHHACSCQDNSVFMSIAKSWLLLLGLRQRGVRCCEDVVIYLFGWCIAQSLCHCFLAFSPTAAASTTTTATAATTAAAPSSWTASPTLVFRKLSQLHQILSLPQTKFVYVSYLTSCNTLIENNHFLNEYK